jgi:uncharacterized protein (TIGR03083 family)
MSRVVEVGAAYAEVQQRLAGLMAGLSADELATPTIACPAWTVQDVFAHHIGVLSDIVAGDLHELGDPTRLLDQWRDPEVARDRDAMTARQVDERRGRSVDSLVDEWLRTTSEQAPMLAGGQPLPGDPAGMLPFVAVNDVVVHEGDIREALGVEVAPEVAATSIALASYGATFDRRLRQLNLPALAFAYGGRTRQFGDGEPAATVAADRTTLVRMLASRLTPAQIRDLDWSGESGPFIAAIPEYGRSRPAAR